MRPLRRSPASTRRTVSTFKKNMSRTKRINVMVGPMRGGIRL